MTWQEKLLEMRDALERMVTECNRDRQYAAGAACQEALQKVACLDDVIEFIVAEKEWKP